MRERLGVFEVRPGITGKAQLLGVDMSQPERLSVLDAEYVRTQNFSQDLQLIIWTLAGGGVGDRVRAL
jgi:O-antigen biosynthesis protein WbqP